MLLRSSTSARLGGYSRFKNSNNNGNDQGLSFTDPRIVEMATRIQRFWRRMRVAYGELGPYHFMRHDGAPASFGTLQFPQKPEPAPFIILSSMTPAPMLGHFMERYWNLSRPEVLISVTGGAQTFQLSPALRQAFDRGLADAASACAAWVLTGGTDTGVMQLVAKALARYEVKQPLIAIAPYGAVLARDALSEQYGRTVPYSVNEPPGFQGAPLNPFHTHYVLVDAGVTGGKAWGTEQALRARFERDCSAAKGVPQALLVVQGGPGTLTMVLESARSGSSILIVSESGGAATAVFEYVVRGAASEAKFQKMAHLLEEIKQLHEKSGGKLITFYALDNGDDFATQLLTAFKNNLLKTSPADEPPPATLSPAKSSTRDAPGLTDGGSAIKRTRVQLIHRTLLLVVRWDRADMLSDLLEELGVETAKAASAKGVAAEPFSYGHHLALQQVIELRRGIDHLEQLVECTGFTCNRVNMCRLYASAEDPFRILSNDIELQAALEWRRCDIDKLRTSDSEKVPAATFAIFQEVLTPFFDKHSPAVAQILRSRQSTAVCERDLFFWSILQGDREYMLFWWSRCQNPMRLALVGAALARSISTLRVVGLGRTALEEIAVTLEDWGVGMLAMINTQEDAFGVLANRVNAWGQRTGAGAPLLDLAMRLEMKTFLSHKHCQALMERWWRGGYAGSSIILDQGCNMLEIAIYALAPFLNPYLEREDVQTGIQRADSEEGPGISSIGASAMGLIFIRRNLQVQLEANGKGGTAADVTALLKSRSDFTEAMRRVDTGQSEAARRKRRAAEEREAKTPRHYTRDFYAVPMVKMATRCLSFLVFVALYTRTLLLSHTSAEIEELRMVPPIDFLQWVFFCFALGHAFDQRYQRLMSEALKSTVAIPFLRLSFFANTALVFAIVARILAAAIPTPDLPLQPDVLSPPAPPLLLAESLVDEGGAAAEEGPPLSWQLQLAVWLYKCHTVGVSYVIVVVFTVQVMIFRSVSDEVGVLVIVIEGMMTDLALFLEIFAITILGFGLGFIGLSPHTSWAEFEAELPLVGGAGAAVDADADPDAGAALRRMLRAKVAAGGSGDDGVDSGVQMGQVLALPVWGVYGDLGLTTLQHIPTSQPLMFIYVLVSTVVLVNLLVAMFSDTYTRIQSAAEKEYRLQKTARTYLYREAVLIVPPPLNLPYVLYALVSDVVQRTVDEAAHEDKMGDGDKVVSSRSRAYLEGFLKKMKAENEGSLEAHVRHIQENELKSLMETCCKLHGHVEVLSAKQEQHMAAVDGSVRALSNDMDKLTKSIGALDKLDD